MIGWWFHLTHMPSAKSIPMTESPEKRPRRKTDNWIKWISFHKVEHKHLQTAPCIFTLHESRVGFKGKRSKHRGEVSKN